MVESFRVILLKVWPTGVLPKKLGLVNFLVFSTINLIQNIRKKQWTNSEKNLLTDRRMDGAEFRGIYSGGGGGGGQGAILSTFSFSSLTYPHSWNRHPSTANIVTRFQTTCYITISCFSWTNTQTTRKTEKKKYYQHVGGGGGGGVEKSEGPSALQPTTVIRLHFTKQPLYMVHST